MLSASSSEIDHPEDPPSPAGAGLASRTFLSLLATQFLGSVNDNILRWLIIGIGKMYMPQAAPVILSLGLALFVLPYLLLAAPAGYLADRFSKRRVIVWCKAGEIVVMLAAVVAILLSNPYALLAMLVLAGAQSALFAPAKLGSIPEMLRPDRISAANGLMGMCNVGATIIGAAGGCGLYMLTGPYGLTDLWISATVMIGLAVLGTLTSFGIAPLKPANPTIPFPVRPLKQTVLDLRTLASDRGLLRVSLGVAFFWTLGSLCQLNIDQFGMEGGMLSPGGQPNQIEVVPLLVALVIGVGLGSLLAGLLSGGRVELGILPLGAGGIAIAAMLLSTVQGDLVSDGQFTVMAAWACLWLFFLGISAGLFDVPLEAYLQHRSPREHRGAVLAASNFLTFFGMLVAAALFANLKKPYVSARTVFLVAGCLTVPVFIYVIWLLPQATIRFVVWMLSHTIYRVRIYGRDNLPETGGALLVANHPSWLDGILLLLASSRPVRMIAWAPNVTAWWSRWACKLMHVIPIGPGPKSMRAALETARQAVLDGELVCIFAEGTISRDGFLQEFKPGMLRIIQGTGVPVVPIYLDELWGSIFSYHGGRAFWKWPRQWPYPVSILFGPPVEHPEDVQQVRRAVELLGIEAIERRKGRTMNLPKAFLKSCRRAWRRSKVADSTGADLTGKQLLMRSLALRRALLRLLKASTQYSVPSTQYSAPDAHSPAPQYVGVLLPPTAVGVVVNATLPLCGRVPVNLNYTLTPETLNFCIGRCQIRQVLTSRRFMEKLEEKGPLNLNAELIYMEDLPPQITKGDKLAAAAQAYLPLGVLARQLGVHRCDPEEVFTVIFTSGSTGEPKGVMLTTKNIATNVAAIDQVVHLRSDDVVLGILPFFHSFGFTITLWTVLTLDVKGIYHTSPLEPRPIGKLCRQHQASVILSTPTFLRGMLRRCEPEDLAKVDVIVTGAEKLPIELADAFEQKFKIRPIEGYGTTELSPLVSVNIPPTRAVGDPAAGVREGTVGRTIPHVMAKVVDLDTGADLPADQPGMLLIQGPNVMKGYLGREDLTAEIIRNGWYKTGDVAVIDTAGFIRITGRQSRFSKIGGEMVPHMHIEETLGKLLTPAATDAAAAAEQGPPQIAVTAVSDERKGERLIVIHTKLDKSPHELCRALAAAGLPPLWIPSPDSFVEVEAIPLLGTGKLDLRALKELAEQRSASGEPRA
ncbi:MAG: MFS transporter [Planctomycetes bacterium]|nr:MFS transporter [Planctomycetota bacterium]